jgi:hypothetical protein
MSAMRPATVAAIAMAIATLAVIALVMGIVAAMPSGSVFVKSCGHLLDARYRGGKATPGCGTEVHQRRIEVGIAAGVAGLAAVIGVVAISSAARDRG